MDVSANRLLALPTIGRLFGRGRLWAWRRGHAGCFGSLIVIEKGERSYHFATLAGAETYNGQPFSAVQLAAAGVIITEDFHGA